MNLAHFRDQHLIDLYQNLCPWSLDIKSSIARLGYEASSDGDGLILSKSQTQAPKRLTKKV